MPRRRQSRIRTKKEAGGRGQGRYRPGSPEDRIATDWDAMATSLTPDDPPNQRTDGRACDESCAGANQDLHVTKCWTSGWAAATAAWPPIADMASAAQQIRFVPMKSLNRAAAQRAQTN